MRKFVVSCIDNETRFYMVYSECSFNGAMCQLEYEGLKESDILKVDIVYINGKDFTRVETKRGIYYYDEYRGYLLRE